MRALYLIPKLDNNLPLRCTLDQIPTLQSSVSLPRCSSTGRRYAGMMSRMMFLLVLLLPLQYAVAAVVARSSKTAVCLDMPEEEFRNGRPDR